MRLLRHASQLAPAGRAVCAAIGTFDGVHLGHQRVIGQAIEDARAADGLSLVVTFDRHPAAMIAPERVPPLLHSLSQKLRAIEALGVDAILLIEFNDAVRHQSGEDFARQLHREIGKLQSICVGRTFAFGHERSGNVTLLERLGAELGFRVHGLDAVTLDGTPISSTRIRNAVQSGDLAAARAMLGRDFSLAGTVEQGDQLGRQLGFPTANLAMEGRALPPHGVYAVRASIDAAPPLPAVLNIGRRPTLKQPQPVLRVEAHLLDFTGDLYGRELEVTLVAKLRDERPFPSLDDLKRQIAADIAQARTLL